MKTILVPVDLSRATLRVCNAACDLARLSGARLVLLHVVPPPPIAMSEVQAFDAGELTEMSTVAEKSALRRLGKLARHCTRRSAKVSTVQRVGSPIAAILAQARSTRAGYIVMGSHGHGAMYDLLVGSTTQAVLKKAPCPVLIVPQGRPRSRAA